MATFNQNILVAATRSSYLLYYLHHTLVAEGWHCEQCGDGSNFYNDGADHLTLLANWSGGGAAANTWSLLREPVGTRVMIIARKGGSNDTECYLGYAKEGTYTNGGAGTVASNSVTPDNEIALFGTYNRTAGPPPTRAVGTCCESSNQYLQAYANTTGFYLVMYRQGTGVVMTRIHLDLLTQCNAADTDTIAIGAKYNTSDPFKDIWSWPCHGAGSGIYAFMNGAGANVYQQMGIQMLHCMADWSAVSTTFPYNSTGTVGGAGTNPWDAKDDTVPAIYARSTALGASAGWKGLSTGLIKLHGTNRANLSLLSVSTTGDRITFGGFSFPWNNAAPSV